MPNGIGKVTKKARLTLKHNGVVVQGGSGAPTERNPQGHDDAGAGMVAQGALRVRRHRGVFHLVHTELGLAECGQRVHHRAGLLTAAGQGDSGF